MDRGPRDEYRSRFKESNRSMGERRRKKFTSKGCTVPSIEEVSNGSSDSNYLGSPHGELTSVCICSGTLLSSTYCLLQIARR